jgi:hypothetical protein
MWTVKVLPPLARRTASAGATLPRPLEIKTSGQASHSLDIVEREVGQNLGGKKLMGGRGRCTRFR